MNQHIGSYEQQQRANAAVIRARLLNTKKAATNIPPIAPIEEWPVEDFNVKTEALPLLAKDYARKRCRDAGLDYDKVFSKVNKYEYSRARQVIWTEIKRIYKKSLPEIGRIFNRDHSTILHGIRKIEILEAGNPEIMDIRKPWKKIIADTDKLNKIRTDYGSGKHIRNICKDHGITMSVLYQLVEYQGWPKRLIAAPRKGRSGREYDVASMGIDYFAGLTLVEIAKKHKACKKVVARMRDAYGWKRNPPEKKQGYGHRRIAAMEAMRRDYESGFPIKIVIAKHGYSERSLRRFSLKYGWSRKRT